MSHDRSFVNWVKVLEEPFWTPEGGWFEPTYNNDPIHKQEMIGKNQFLIRGGEFSITIAYQPRPYQAVTPEQANNNDVINAVRHVSATFEIWLATNQGGGAISGNPAGEQPQQWAPFMHEGVSTAFRIGRKSYKFIVTESRPRTLTFRFFRWVQNVADWGTKKYHPVFIVKCIPGDFPSFDRADQSFSCEVTSRLCFSALKARYNATIRV